MLPTVCTTATCDIPGALPQRSIAKVKARRTRTSSNGFFWWLNQTPAPQFQSDDWISILSPSSPFSCSIAEGG